MFIIDRFEGDFAVVENTENEKMTLIERNTIDKSAREGDVIFSFDGVYKVDIEATKRRREEVLELMRKIDIR